MKKATIGPHYNVFEDIGRGLAGVGVKPGKMFGHPCLKVPNGKIAATYYHDDLLVKLPPEKLESTLAQKGVKVFEPMPGRKMTGWAQVPADYADDWETLVVDAFNYINS